MMATWNWVIGGHLILQSCVSLEWNHLCMCRKMTPQKNFCKFSLLTKHINVLRIQGIRASFQITVVLLALPMLELQYLYWQDWKDLEPFKYSGFVLTETIWLMVILGHYTTICFLSPSQGVEPADSQCYNFCERIEVGRFKSYPD